MKKKSLYENILIIGAGFFVLIMVIFPEQTEWGAKEGILLWLNSVVPILFPFFIFSDFMKRMGVADRAPANMYPLVMAIMSGYPMGAKIVGDMVLDGVYTRDKGKWVLSYSLVTGPAFILGTIRGFMGSSKAAAIVAVAHYLGGLLNGLIYKNHDCNCVDMKVDRKRKYICKNTNPLEQFTSAIISSTRGMAIILAYLVVFMIGIELLSKSGLFQLIGNDTVSSFMKGILEMTIGSKSVCISGTGIPVKIGMVSFFVSFGGISIIGQSASMLGKSGITFLDVLQIKMTHGFVSGIIAVILGIFML